jgi:ubiquinone/menaquinone biosynthesis C-methylase UbiE
MPIPPKSPQEQPNTYAIQGHSKEELTRLRIQDEAAALTLGLIPEQTDPARFQRILDVACGTGGWLIRMAKNYPTIPLLIGADVSQRMLDYARAQAREQKVDDRVEFHQMDVLRRLEFPTDFFDLINQRFAMSYLRTWDWPKLLQEFQRVSRPGGIIRLTEGDFPDTSSSPALVLLCQQMVQAACKAGHIFAPNQNGVSGEIERLLQQYGELENVQTHLYAVEHRAGTADGQLFVEDEKHIFRTALPFLQKWTHLPANYEEIYQQMVREIERPDFVASVRVVTAWGTKRF